MIIWIEKEESNSWVTALNLKWQKTAHGLTMPHDPWPARDINHHKPLRMQGSWELMPLADGTDVFRIVLSEPKTFGVFQALNKVKRWKTKQTHKQNSLQTPICTRLLDLVLQLFIFTSHVHLASRFPSVWSCKRSNYRGKSTYYRTCLPPAHGSLKLRSLCLVRTERVGWLSFHTARNSEHPSQQDTRAVVYSRKHNQPTGLKTHPR